MPYWTADTIIDLLGGVEAGVKDILRGARIIARVTLYYILVFALLLVEMIIFALLIIQLPYEMEQKLFAFINESPIIAKLEYGLRRGACLYRSVVKFRDVAKSSNDDLMRALQLLQDYERLCAPLVQFCPEWFNPDEDQAVYKLRDQRQALENDMREHQLTYGHEVAKFNKDNREEEVLHDEVLPHRYPYSIARLAIVAILATLVVARLFYNYVSKVWVPGFIQGQKCESPYFW